MYIKTCKIFYQKNKYKVFYKNITADCLSYPTLSPPFLYFTHPFSHLPKPVTTPIGDATLRSTPPAPFTTLRFHSVGTLRLRSGGTTIRSWPVLSSEKLLRGGRGEPCHRRSVAHYSNLVSLETSSLRSLTWNWWEWVGGFFFPSWSGFLGWLGGCGGWLGGFVDSGWVGGLWWLAGWLLLIFSLRFVI